MTVDCAPIFVIGTGRSGTTLLRLMLCAHPRIYLTHEASFYVWEKAFRPRAARREFLNYYVRTPSFRWLRLDPARVLGGLPEPLPRARLRDVYASVMREKAADYGRARFGDKTPSHAAFLGRIYEDFPDARVVHIVRDPRSTALSLSRMPWACGSLYANALFCELERKQVAPYRDRILQIRLEDLLASPRATMGRVLEFVGEPWNDAVLDHARHAPDRSDMPPLPWLESATRGLSAPASPWAELTPIETRMIERVTRRLMTESDYQPARLEREPSRRAVLWARLRQIPEIVRCAAAYWEVAKYIRDPRCFDTQRVIDLMHRVNPGSWARYPGFELPFAPSLDEFRAPALAARRDAAVA